MRIVGLTVLAAAASALVSAPLQARNVNGWEVARTKAGACMMTANFEDGSNDGVSLALTWNEAEGKLGFLAASKHWNGLMKETGDPTSLLLTFDGDVTYTQWLHETARFQNLGRGTEAVAGSWGPENSDDLAEAVTRSRQVSVVVGDTDLGSFDISGSSEAYRELRRCGARG